MFGCSYGKFRLGINSLRVMFDGREVAGRNRDLSMTKLKLVRNTSSRAGILKVSKFERHLVPRIA